jgi:hypothetical protein
VNGINGLRRTPFAIIALAMAPPGFAFDRTPRPVYPVILSVAADCARDTLVITGRHFGAGFPAVQLGDVALEVKSASAERIVARLSPGLQPATYRLAVTRRDGRQPLTSDAFHAALFGVGGECS